VNGDGQGSASMLGQLPVVIGKTGEVGSWICFHQMLA
jgi:hypothetical protein